MTIFRTHDKNDSQHIRQGTPRNVPIGFIDPGAEGVALIWDAGVGVGDWPRPPDKRVTLGGYGSGNRTLATVGAERGVEVWVIEDQFFGSNPKTTKRLAWTCGVIVGHILQAKPVLEVVSVPPASWQTILPRVGKREKGDTKRLALAHSRARLGDWIDEQGNRREACADTFSMADWFEWYTRS